VQNRAALMWPASKARGSHHFQKAFSTPSFCVYFMDVCVCTCCEKHKLHKASFSRAFISLILCIIISRVHIHLGRDKRRQLHKEAPYFQDHASKRSNNNIQTLCVRATCNNYFTKDWLSNLTDLFLNYKSRKTQI